MKKTLICLLLILGLVAGMLASCGSPDNSGGKETKEGTVETKDGTPASSETQGINPGENETSKPFIPDSLQDEDLKDYIFNILYSDRGLLVISEVDDYTGDLIEDGLYNTMSAVKERFHCQFDRFHGGTDNEMAAKLETTVQSGDRDVYSMTMGHDYLTIRNALKGYYANLNDIEAFDFSKPWWPENNLKGTSIGNKLYAASSYVSYSPMQGAQMIVFNKNMVRDMELTDPYELVFSKDWTVENMTSLAQDAYTDSNSDGTIDPEQGEVYGFYMGSQAGYSWQRSMDVVSVAKDSEDYPEYGLDPVRADEMIELLNGLLEWGYFNTDDNKIQDTLFAQGSIFMMTSSLRNVYLTIRSIDTVKYGFLPDPLLNDEQSDYIAGATDMIWGIPTTSTDHSHEIGVIIEALSCLAYNDILPLFYESTMQTKLSDAPEDVQVLDIIRDSTTLSFAYFYSQNLGGLEVSMADLPRQCRIKHMNPATMIAANQGPLELNIAKLIEEYEKLG